MKWKNKPKMNSNSLRLTLINSHIQKLHVINKVIIVYNANDLPLLLKLKSSKK